MKEKKELEIVDAISRLEDWFDDNGLYGWDPYDVQDSRIFRFIENFFPRLLSRIFIRLLSEFNYIFPINFRRIAGIKPSINNKGLGLLLSSYSSLYKFSKDEKHLNKAVSIANDLLKNSNKSYSGYSWGYPFDWVSPILIPAGMPSSVVSSIVGDGFYRLYQITKNKKYLDVCEKICNFFLENLETTYTSSDKTIVCYSYTPIDDYQVHNANLFVAEFLIKIGNHTDNKHFIDQGIRSANFALMEQTKEGFLPYWDLEQTDRYSNGKIHTDHYHCGFEIRTLYSIWKNTNIAEFKIAHDRYFSWYKKNMFTENLLPKYTSKSLYPINIHTSAEAILCNTVMAKNDEDIKFTLNLAIKIVQDMEYAPGKYTHLIKKILGIKVKSNIPLLRWGQAWMFLALIDLNNLKKNGIET